METITSQNLLYFIKAYFSSLGLKEEAEEYFTAKTFFEGIILKLPTVCLVPTKKPRNSKSKQTHIHVTGKNRYFFYERTEIESARTSSNDQKCPLTLSEQNINDLMRAPIITKLGLLLDDSFTMTKVACREGQKTQVQISKLKLDEEKFIKLRKHLHENDLLIFLKPRNKTPLFVIGIPKKFYQNNYKVATTIYSGLESPGTISVKKALETVKAEYEDITVINSDAAIFDAIYQEMVHNTLETSPTNTSYEAIPYLATEPKTGLKTKRPRTNPALGKEAIRQNKYRCEADSNHTTFKKINGEPYMEVHHLIPLEQQSIFANKLDTKANLIALCPLCHRLLHYGQVEQKKPILRKLFQKRQAPLKQSGLKITLEKLMKFYE